MKRRKLTGGWVKIQALRASYMLAPARKQNSPEGEPLTGESCSNARIYIIYILLYTYYV